MHPRSSKSPKRTEGYIILILQIAGYIAFLLAGAAAFIEVGYCFASDSSSPFTGEFFPRCKVRFLVCGLSSSTSFQQLPSSIARLEVAQPGAELSREESYMDRRRVDSPRRKPVLKTLPASLWAAVIVVTLQLAAPSLHVCVVAGALRVGHYALSCPSAESIVRRAMERSMQLERSIVAGVLRLHFHDCFVEGCDGSVLLDGPNSEKAALPNLSLRGYEVVDAAKADLEAQCPGVVSCADILAFAARDAVELTGGLGWRVRAGRLDGRVSSAARANADIPDPSFTVSQITELFARKGLSKSDMIVLSGAHTIGRAHCVSVMGRLYPVQEAQLSEAMATRLRSACPPQGSGATLNLDSATPDRFDNMYYTNQIHHRGVLHSDQALFNDISTRGETVFNALLAGPWAFQFSRVMVQMGNIQVKTGPPEGEIRRNCRFIN